MSLAGEGLVSIWNDILPEARGEFYEWHNREHMPERVGIPGFRRGRRYIAEWGQPEYFTLYEADSLQTLQGRDYLERLDSPTEWTKRVVRDFRAVSRALQRVTFSSGPGMGGHILTLRLAQAPDSNMPLFQAAGDAGITGVHLAVTDEGASNVETAEKKARANPTEVPGATILLEGTSRAAVEAAAARLERLEGERGLYRLEYVRTKTSFAP